MAHLHMEPSILPKLGGAGSHKYTPYKQLLTRLAHVHKRIVELVLEEELLQKQLKDVDDDEKWEGVLEKVHSACNKQVLEKQHRAAGVSAAATEKKKFEFLEQQPTDTKIARLADTLIESSQESALPTLGDTQTQQGQLDRQLDWTLSQESATNAPTLADSDTESQTTETAEILMAEFTEAELKTALHPQPGAQQQLPKLLPSPQPLLPSLSRWISSPESRPIKRQRGSRSVGDTLEAFETLSHDPLGIL